MTSFLDAFSYPFRKGGWVALLTGAGFSLVLEVGQWVPIVGIPVAVFSAGFFAAVFLRIVATTMIGDDELPDWPSVTALVDDILLPLLRVLGLGIIAFAPWLVVSFWPLFGFPALGGREEELLYATWGLGMVYLPMAVLGSVVYGNLWGALPHVVLPAIFRAMPVYLFALVALALTVAAGWMVDELTGKLPPLRLVVMSLVGLYGLMVQGRLIGLIYRERREALGWG